jgi:hypothetical protein
MAVKAPWARAGYLRGLFVAGALAPDIDHA